jgi:hypothetical protein
MDMDRADEVTWPGPPRPVLSVDGPYDEVTVWREPDGTWRGVILPGAGRAA